MKRAAILSISLTLAGCVQVGPKTLFPVRDEAAPAVGAALPRNEAACELPDLPPIAQNVRLIIKPNQPIDSNDGGKALALGYGDARDAIRACKGGAEGH
ncbi:MULTISPECIES: hypothetical protein [unclassified Methylococcus]|uniref:hypothetical protein n=1 Tax=unclassified Methylococcus TaxID=2618889 RepID=UPI003D7E5FCD